MSTPQKESNKANVQKTQMIEHLTYYSCLFMPGTTKKIDLSNI